MASIHELLERGLQRVVEALIFAADVPVSASMIAEVYSEVTGEDRPEAAQIREAVDRLNQAYDDTERSFRIEPWAEGFRMATVSSVAPFLKAYFNREQEYRLSRSLLETLSIVAYKQPCTKPEIDFVRGVDSGYAVSKLLEKGLVDVVGRSDSLGRPLLYGTTDFFLDQFGLKSLDSLPDLREIEEILDDPAFNKERAQLLMLQQEDDGAGSGAVSAGRGSDAQLDDETLSNPTNAAPSSDTEQEEHREDTISDDTNGELK